MNNLIHPIHPKLRFLEQIAYSLLLVLALSVGLTQSVQAQEKATIQASFGNNAQAVKIDVLVGQSRLIEFDEEYGRISISDPKVAEVVPISYRQVLINGLTFGQVNLVAWAKRPQEVPERMLVFDIFVQVNLSLIDNQIKILFPRENIQLSQANNSVVLSGTVTKPELAEQAQKVIEAAGLKVTNLLKVPVMDAAQVQLQIRVAEVNRSVLREVSSAYGIANRALPAYLNSGGPAVVGGSGIDLVSNTVGAAASVTPGANILLGNADGGAGMLGFVRALYARGALRDLAEPNLIAMHGQKASFLAGGEFPIPIVSSLSSGQNSITVVYKEFGVKLDFTPTIIDENHIRLELCPEVSSLDYASGVQLANLVIPGLRVRRAKTTLELRDGQSFALAGLIDNTERVNLSKIPLVGEIPVLGELFKSRSFQRNETELLFLATVKIVEPLNPDQVPQLPGVSELKPVGSTLAAPVQAASVEGQSGHSVPRKTTEAENKNRADQRDNFRIDTPNLTSVVVGPSGVDPAKLKRPEHPEPKGEKSPPPENKQPEKP
jgi:pilus assembly protein CpaC